MLQNSPTLSLVNDADVVRKGYDEVLLQGKIEGVVNVEWEKCDGRIQVVGIFSFLSFLVSSCILNVQIVKVISISSVGFKIDYVCYKILP